MLVRPSSELITYWSIWVIKYGKSRSMWDCPAVPDIVVKGKWQRAPPALVRTLCIVQTGRLGALLELVLFIVVLSLYSSQLFINIIILRCLFWITTCFSLKINVAMWPCSFYFWILHGAVGFCKKPTRWNAHFRHYLPISARATAVRWAKSAHL